MAIKHDTALTTGPITKSLILFALPMMAGNLLQQLYNVADTIIVGRFLGADTLAAVGSAYTLMTFLTSILLGLCMGSGALFSIRWGEGDRSGLKSGIFHAFVFIASVTIVLNIAVFLLLDPILVLLQVPHGIIPLMHTYLWCIFWGIPAVFLYNYFAALLRAVGNSVVPLVFLGISAILNIALDLTFVLICSWGVAGAAIATVIAQYVSGIGIAVYTLIRLPMLVPAKEDCRWSRRVLGEIVSFSLLTCVQQSIMNFGILMVQGLVNSFGEVVMAAFAAAVKIDSFAYMPVQDFGNAFSTFIAQNYGARSQERIRKGTRSAVICAAVFCVAVSAVVCLFAAPLMGIFVDPTDPAVAQITAVGVQYLWIEGACYCGIGILFLLYGFYRAVRRPAMSVVLTVFSLGTRVALAYALAPQVGVWGIWISVPIGWALADLVGAVYYFRRRAALLPESSSF